MVYVDHLRLTWGGGLGAATPAPEEWSCTINMGRAAGGHHVPDQTMADDIWDLWNTDILTLSQMGAAVSLEYAKVSAIDTTGHVVGTVYRHDEHDAAGGTTYLLPFQSAVAVSLRTGVRGPSHRGRFFLPMLNVETAYTTGEMTTTDQAAIQAAAATFLGHLNALNAGVDDVIVASSKGYNTVVTEVVVGRVVDTQRRRRRSLDEAYGTPTAI